MHAAGSRQRSDDIDGHVVVYTQGIRIETRTCDSSFSPLCFFLWFEAVGIFPFNHMHPRWRIPTLRLITNMNWLPGE